MENFEASEQQPGSDISTWRHHQNWTKTQPSEERVN